MKRQMHIKVIVLGLVLGGGSVGSAAAADLPWQEAGLSERQAAAHLLGRFTFGPRPGEIDRAVEMGLEVWLERQLRGGIAEPRLEAKLSSIETLGMSAREIAQTYPLPGRLLAMARRQGLVSMEESPDGDSAAGRAMRRQVMELARQEGYRPLRELVEDLMTQKLYRALEAENQLVEVLTDFWFNHFNVSLTDFQTRVHVLSYERDAIRPHVAGRFRTMLEATASHPAMLLYLDNARSGANTGQTTTVEQRMGALRRRDQIRGGRQGRSPARRPQRNQPGNDNGPRRPQGLNENYARELLELHTLGVDGGYSQEDVIAVARAFTGWAFLPPEVPMERLPRGPQRQAMGFVLRDNFVFRPDIHDAEEKTILGRTLASGRGIEDGREVLDILSRHPSTADHVARKLAIRFVSDEPPATLVNRLAASFRKSDGDLPSVVRTLAYSPEFWSAAARRQKIKSPLEVTVSALRSLDAQVHEPGAILDWISRMGQPLYAYQAPTGFPDRAEHWVNTGSLLNRMNFGLQLAGGRIPGVRFDLLALNQNREPESIHDALGTYAHLLLPERDLTETLSELEPLVTDPQLLSKIEEAAPNPRAEAGQEPASGAFGSTGDRPGRGRFTGFGDRPGTARGRRFARQSQPRREPPPAILSSVVGVILGSPEFQRR